MAEQYDVLIIEDDPDLAEVMAGALTRGGLSVAMAHDGATALQGVEEITPRVVLLDCNLPDCTGVELAEKLRALLPRSAIMLMSGNVHGISEETLRRLDIRAFVNKPVPMRALREAVTKLVREPVSRMAHEEPGWLATGLGGTRS